MSLSFRELPGGVLPDTRLYHAEVAVCQTLAQADSLAAASRLHWRDQALGRMLTFASGYWFVVLIQDELTGDTDVKNHND